MALAPQPHGAADWRSSVNLEVGGIHKEFGATPALHGIDLTIDSGELIALLGPSGSGKTTLLRIIAGLDFPDTGHVLLGGEDASQKRVQDRKVGFVFQHYALFRHMTVFDNIAFGLRVRKRRERPPEAEVARRVNQLLDLVQLPDLGKRYPAQLSGGQRQRIAFARALAVEPRVLLLDEPFGALDAKVRRELRRWLRDFHNRTGHTTIFVTHDQDEALEVADRVVVMNKGRIEQVGAPQEVYDTPASPFVYDFIGESSRFEVEVFSGKPYFDERAVSLPFNDLCDGRQAIYFRPQDAIVEEPRPGLVNGIIKALRRSGAAHRLELAIGVSERIVEAQAPENGLFGVGQRAGLRLKRGGAFVLPG
jgi:sulfate transport system ATP-binding protein